MPPKLDKVTVTFDFLELDSWDGERFIVHVDGKAVDLGRFTSTVNEGARSGRTADGIEWTTVASGGPAHLGGQNWGNAASMDQVHKVTLTIPAELITGDLTLRFTSTLDQNAHNESFGLDNLKITGHLEDEDCDCACVSTKVLLHESFTGLCKLSDSDNVLHTAWDAKWNAAVSTHCEDGALTFRTVHLDGHKNAVFQFDAKAWTINHARFEGKGQHGEDSLKVQISVDGGAWVTIDTFYANPHTGVFTGDKSGQTFGANFKTLTYANVNLPADADKVQFRLFSELTARDEFIKIDNVKITAAKDDCVDCPDGSAKIDFEGLAKGTVVSDQIEGVTISAFVEKEICVTVQAEHMTREGFVKVHGANASGGELVRLNEHVSQGKLSTTFNGPDATYDLHVRIQDENDGVSTIKVLVDGVERGTITLDRNNNGGGSDGGHFSTFVVRGLEIDKGQKVELVAHKGGHEFVRIDRLDFKATVLENRAMVFDSAHPTGGDTDLRTTKQGKILIISEDGDSSDPDDEAHGGQIHVAFDRPATVTSLVVIDTEEGGSIVALDEDGNVIKTVAIPKIGDGKQATVKIDAEGVAKLQIKLNGSGAIDDICYTPGDEEPELGSLSGRYFLDTDNDDQDNGNGNEPAIEGVRVELLDGNGNPTGATTTTDANGNYSFGNLVPGTYGVRFTDPSGVLAGLVLVTANQGADASDSDAIGNTTLATISAITVVGGQNTPDNDAGAEVLLGSLSGRYFLDTDNDDQDNGNGNEPAIEGVRVELLDGNGNPTGATTTTDANGNYSFGNLVPGTYGVRFTDPSGVLAGLVLVTANQGADASDSDAIGNTTLATISAITVVGGQNTPDNDAGAENVPPTAEDAEGCVCSDEETQIDVTFADTNDTSAGIVGLIVDGALVRFADNGGIITTESGAEVTLADGDTLTYSLVGDDIFDDLLVRTSETDSFIYVVEDARGAQAQATVDVKVCGAKNTLETIEANLPVSGNAVLTIGNATTFFTVTISGTGNPDFDRAFDIAYCVAADVPITPGSSVPVSFDVLGPTVSSSVVTNPQNVGYVNWILNQNFTSIDNGDGTGQTYTEGEIQGAIWGFTDGFSFLDDVPNSFGTDANTLEIYNAALAAGSAAQNFVPDEGDIVAILLRPANPNAVQPLIIGIEFDELKLPCECDCLV